MIGPLVPRKDGGWHCTRCSKPPAPLLGDKYRDFFGDVLGDTSCFLEEIQFWCISHDLRGVQAIWKCCGIFGHIGSVAQNDYPKCWFLKGHRLPEYTCFVISNHAGGKKKAGTGNETNNGNCNFYFLNFHRDQTANVIYRSDRIQEPQILAKHLGSLSIIAPQKKLHVRHAFLCWTSGEELSMLSSSFGGGESQTLHPDGFNSVCLRKHMKLGLGSKQISRLNPLKML